MEIQCTGWRRRSPEERWVDAPSQWSGSYEVIAERAYFKAQRRGFAGGRELDDWLEAEREVSRLPPSRGACDERENLELFHF